MTESLERDVRELRSRFWSVLDPEGRAFAALADAYRRSGDHREAQELLEDGLGRLPEFASGHVVAGRVHRDRGDSEAAARSFQRVLELDPENVEALRSLADLAETRGEREETLDLLHRLTELEPRDPEIDARISRLRSAQGAPAPGSAAGGPALDVEEEEPLADIESPAATPPAGRGAAPLEAGAADDRLVGGGDAFDAWDEEEGADLYTETMGELYASQGLVDRAVEVYQRLLEADPENPRFRERLRALRSESGAGAVAADERAVETPARAEPAAPPDVADAADAELDELAEAWAAGPDETGDLSTPFAWSDAEEPLEPEEGGPRRPMRAWLAEILAWRPREGLEAPPPEAVPVETLAPDAPEPAAAAESDVASVDSVAPHETALDVGPEATGEVDAVPIESLAPDEDVDLLAVEPSEIVPIESLAPDAPEDRGEGSDREDGGAAGFEDFQKWLDELGP